MMKALLDTNIIIHRENTQATNYSIGILFYWLDKLRYEKYIHPLTINELRKLHNPNIQLLYDAKLDAYTELRTIAPQTDEFRIKLAASPKTQNDVIDNQLLCEVYSNRVDILITEDRRMRWGFKLHGKKLTNGLEESVLVKPMKIYDVMKSPRENFPNLIYNRQKFILPIYRKISYDFIT